MNGPEIVGVKWKGDRRKINTIFFLQYAAQLCVTSDSEQQSNGVPEITAIKIRIKDIRHNTTLENQRTWSELKQFENGIEYWV